MSQQETQQSVSDWALHTFGDTGSNVRVAVRANEEMAELLRELTINDHSPKAPKEIADIIIVLWRLGTRMGANIQDEIDQKMAVNRGREWTLDASGCGKHVRDKAPEKAALDSAAATAALDHAIKRMGEIIRS